MDTDMRQNDSPNLKKNLVRTVFIWPNGGMSSKVIDLNTTQDRLRFANLAARCYSCNGVVICHGVNAGQPVTEIAGVEINGVVRDIPVGYPINVA